MSTITLHIHQQQNQCFSSCYEKNQVNHDTIRSFLTDFNAELKQEEQLCDSKKKMKSKKERFQSRRENPILPASVHPSSIEKVYNTLIFYC